MNTYDWLLARRTVAIGLVLGALGFLAMLGTDDLASVHAGRLGRLAVLASLAGGGAAFLVTAQARSRGEMRALAATGVPPIKASLGAVVGGMAIGAVGAALALAPGVDMTPLFPRALPLGSEWIWQGDAWVDSMRGILVRADGDLRRVGTAVGRAPVSGVPAARTILLALLLASFAIPLWATARGPILRRVFVASAAAAGAVLVFHLVAAAWVPAIALALPPSLLLVDALDLHRRGAWS